MSKPVTLCVPTLNQYSLLEQCIQSARAGSLPPSRVVVIDNGGGWAGMEGVEVHKFGRNLGVAGSWNWFLKNCEDHVVISNDDVKFHHGTIEALVTTAESMPDQIFFCASVGQAWSCFLQRKVGIELVGEYDEGFWPAYHEDGDFAYRMKLIGQHENFTGCGYDHVGSATIRSMSGAERAEADERFRRTQARYVAKWGGEPGKERYTKPFNL